MVGLLNYPKEYRSFGLTNKKISVDPGFLDERLSCSNTWDQEGFPYFVRVYVEFIFGSFNEPTTLSKLFCLAKRPNSALNVDKQLGKSCLLFRQES